MSRMIQIRNVPDDLHRAIKARAALEGMTLSDFLLAELKRLAERPSLRDLRMRLATRKPVAVSTPLVGILREEREAR